MRPNLFVSEDDYRARIDTLIERVRAAPRADGYAEVLLPGEPEDRIEDERRKRGIPYAASEVAALAGRSEEGRRPAAGVSPTGRSLLKDESMKIDAPVNGYDIDVMVIGYPGKTVCHGGLGWSTIVLLRGHGRVAMIDTGGMGVRRHLIEKLKERGLEPEDVTDLLLSHAHYDHILNWTTFQHARIVIGGRNWLGRRRSLGAARRCPSFTSASFRAGRPCTPPSTARR